MAALGSGHPSFPRASCAAALGLDHKSLERGFFQAFPFTVAFGHLAGVVVKNAELLFREDAFS